MDEPGITDAFRSRVCVSLNCGHNVAAMPVKTLRSLYRQCYNHCGRFSEFIDRCRIGKSFRRSLIYRSTRIALVILADRGPSETRHVPCFTKLRAIFSPFLFSTFWSFLFFFPPTLLCTSWKMVFALCCCLERDTSDDRKWNKNQLFRLRLAILLSVYAFMRFLFRKTAICSSIASIQFTLL